MVYASHLHQDAGQAVAGALPTKRPRHSSVFPAIHLASDGLHIGHMHFPRAQHGDACGAQVVLVGAFEGDAAVLANNLGELRAAIDMWCLKIAELSSPPLRHGLCRNLY